MIGLARTWALSALTGLVLALILALFLVFRDDEAPVAIAEAPSESAAPESQAGDQEAPESASAAPEPASSEPADSEPADSQPADSQPESVEPAIWRPRFPVDVAEFARIWPVGQRERLAA